MMREIQHTVMKLAEFVMYDPAWVAEGCEKWRKSCGPSQDVLFEDKTSTEYLLTQLKQKVVN